MPIINPSVSIVPSVELRGALTLRELTIASHAAYYELTRAGAGLDIAHYQFRFRDHTLALASRVRLSGRIEIELGFGDPGRPASLFTAAQLRAAEQEMIRRANAARRRG